MEMAKQFKNKVGRLRCLIPVLRITFPTQMKAMKKQHKV